MSTIDPKVQEFVDFFTQSFNTHDIAALQTMSHEVDEITRLRNSESNQFLIHEGYKIVDTSLQIYKQPNWSIFREYQFEPTPSYSVSVQLKNHEGKSIKHYYAIALENGSYKMCYYVEVKKKPKVGNLKIQVEKSRIERFISTGVKKFSKQIIQKRMQQIVFEFSLEQGLLTLSFDTRPDYDPGDCERMSHYDFHRLILTKWANFFEDGKTLIGTDGEIYNRFSSDDGITMWSCGERTYSAEEVIGQTIVDIFMEMRRSGFFSSEFTAPNAMFEVGDIEGIFGWPPYEERGRENTLVPHQA